MRGIIVKGIAGFYYVKSLEEENKGQTFSCKAKGIFRKENNAPQVGDFVEIDVIGGEEGNICKILPRQSLFIRPPVANISQLIVTFAVAKPAPNLVLVDKLLVTCAHKDIGALVLITKEDLDGENKCEDYREIYEKAKYPVLVMHQDDEAAAQRLKAAAKDKISAFAGCSGVGKSSALNKLSDTINMETGKISEKIARGRHTTRHVELLALDGGGYVLDTPGFSSVELPGMEPGELSACFPEFLAHENCRFRGCSHTSEPGCGVKEALAAGEIAPSRYENYLLFYSQLKEREAHRYD